MTNAELAILSLIAETPRHGYEIEQTIESRGMREWTEIGFSSIYYLLKKLEQAGLIESQLQQTEGRGPARKVYQITPDGRAAQLAATLEALSEPKPSYTPFLLGVANLPALSPEQTLNALRAYREGLRGRREHVTACAEAQRPLPDHIKMMFDYSLAMIEAEINWIEIIIQKTETQND